MLLTLFLSSCVAFYVSRFDFRVNLFLLLVFTAGNLLPQQVIITPCTGSTCSWTCPASP